MLSGRLSSVEAEHRDFCEHFGWNRRSEEISDFVAFLKADVDIRSEMDWPFVSERTLAVEVGNHMYLHYGTHAAADPGNNWQSHARIGAGEYPWLSRHPADTFTEQRDNIVKNTELLQALLGITPQSFTIPSDVYDAERTPSGRGGWNPCCL